MKHLPTRIGLALCGAAALSLTSCEEPVTCGTGTKLNEETNQCLPTATGPDLNVIVDDFSLGNFNLTQVDVPEQLQLGFPSDDKTFNIKNTGTEAVPVTLIRINLVKVDALIDELQEAVESIGSEDACEADTDCATTSFCDPESGLCKMNPVVIGSAIIPDLGPGEERTIHYTLNLPPDFTGTGVYGYLWTLNEVALIPDPTYAANAETDCEDTPTRPCTQYMEDPEHAIVPGTIGYERAAAVFAPATVLVGATDKPNLRVLSSSIDNHAFTVSPSPDPSEPAPIQVTTTISAQGKDITSAVTTRFELHLPGYVLSVAGKDLGEDYFLANGLDFEAAPDASTYLYDAERVLHPELDIGPGGERGDSLVVQPECVNEACTQVATVQNDLGRDSSFALHFSAFDQRLLAMTAQLDEDDTTNAVLDGNGEQQGTLKVIFSMDEEEYAPPGAGGAPGQPLTADNEKTFDVVFQAPVAGRDADPDTDTDENPVSETQAPLYPALDVAANYAEVDNLTPTWNWGVGNDWMGAFAQIQNVSSKQRLSSTVVAQKVTSSNYVRLKALKQDFDIVNISGNVDWGTRRTNTAGKTNLQSNKASAKLTLFGSTYLDVNLLPNPNSLPIQCQQTETDFYSCLLFEGEARPRTNEGPPTQTKRNKKKIYLNYSRERKWFFAVGPLPFEVSIGVSAGLGMRANVSFIEDRRANDGDGSAVMSGLQVTIGPVADAGGSAFGGLSLGLLRAGVKGTVTFLSVEFQPAFLIGLNQEMDETNSCWNYNGGQIRLEGPLTVTVLSGSVDVVVEGGICACFPWVGCACAWGTIFSFNIVKIPPAWSNTWQLFENTYNISSLGGLCPTPIQATPAPPPSETWNSPIGCTTWTGAQGYCNFAPGTGSFTKTFSRPGVCKTMTINGRTERFFDFVTVRDQAGNVLMRDSGAFTGRQVTFCNQASVSLTSDYSIIDTGVTVSVPQ